MHQNFQGKFHSSQWFMVACVDIINIETTSLCVSTNKSAESKAGFRQYSIRCACFSKKSGFHDF